MTISRKTTAAHLPEKQKPGGGPRFDRFLRGVAAHPWLTILTVCLVLIAATFVPVPWPYLAAGLGLFVFAAIAVLGSAGKKPPQPQPAQPRDDPMRIFAGLLIVVGIIIALFLSFVGGAIVLGLAVVILAIRRPVSNRKPCPSCAELIRPEALVCRYCGRAISASAGAA